jgi:hypothetical protein
VSLIVEIPNNRIHSDSKKRRSFVALLFAAGDAWRYVLKRRNQWAEYFIWQV